MGSTLARRAIRRCAGVDAGNVGRLGLAWYADLDTGRGQEATPLVVDGVVYTSSSWSNVYAFDGRTGRRLWKFDARCPAGARRPGPAVMSSTAASPTGKGGCTSARSMDGWSRSTRATARWSESGLTVDTSKPVYDHRRAAHRPRQGDHRQRRCGVRRARLCVGLRRRGRCAALALLHGARGSVAAVRESGPAPGRGRLERRVVEGRRRRYGLGFHGLRPAARSALHRRRQRLAVEREAAQSRWQRPLILHRCVAARPASTCGVPRRRRARCGTTPPPSTWCWPTS